MWSKSHLRRLKANINLAAESLDDERALETVEMFPEWAAGVSYPAGCRVQFNGVLYRCVQAHTSQADWQPDQTQALWAVVSVEEWPAWVQPIGAHDAYARGDKVSHNDKHWISDMDANVYEPGVAGWTEQS